MRWRPWTAALLLALAAAPLVAPPAAGVSPCLASPTHAPQDDADTGADAPDARDAAVQPPIPAPNAQGDLYAYYWGWLDAPQVPGGDANDWYRVTLKGQGERVMLSIVSNYSAAMTLYYGAFQLDVYGPGDAQPLAHTDSNDDRGIAFDNARAGVFAFHVFVDGGAAPCGTGSLPTLGDETRLVRNHGVYFGCHPFCVDELVHG